MKGRLTLVAVLALVGGIVWLGAYLSQGSQLIATETSPDRREELRLYTASRWQHLLDGNADLLGHATLVDAVHDKVMASSAPFDMSGHSEVVWRPDRLQVGSSAVYDRATGRWTVLQ